MDIETVHKLYGPKAFEPIKPIEDEPRPRTLEEQEALEASLLEEARRTGQDHYKYLCKVDRTREEFAAGADLPDLIRFMRPIAGTELVKRTYYSVADKRLLGAVEAMLRTKTHEDPSDPSK